MVTQPLLQVTPGSQSLLRTRFLLRLYSRVTHGQGGAFTQLLLWAPPGDPHSAFTPSLLQVYSAFEVLGSTGRTYSRLTPDLLQAYSAPYSGLAQLPFLGCFRSFCATQPLLSLYSAFTQPLLSPHSGCFAPLGLCSALTPSLLSLCSEVTQPLLGCYSALTQPLLRGYSGLAWPRPSQLGLLPLYSAPPPPAQPLPPLLRGCSDFTHTLLSPARRAAPADTPRILQGYFTDTHPLHSALTPRLLRGYSDPEGLSRRYSRVTHTSLQADTLLRGYSHFTLGLLTRYSKVGRYSRVTPRLLRGDILLWGYSHFTPGLLRGSCPSPSLTQDRPSPPRPWGRGLAPQGAGSPWPRPQVGGGASPTSFMTSRGEGEGAGPRRFCNGTGPLKPPRERRERL
ncbi:uncharacterized protein LOC120511911 [Passer montanus]|uniref:uncharacterized protein LOC120511911 n=1 Tax=Passer montanus TaxID=9160 RepID=UPI00196045FF|nr:uncharacterized protein LOC120511911 [Passer montanus]